MYPNQPPQEPQPTPPPWPPQAPQQTPPPAQYSPTPSAYPEPGQPMLPPDYLNQIAPQTQKKPIFTFGLKQVIIAAIGLIILMLILVGVVKAVGGGQNSDLEHLSARLTATQTIADNAQVNLKSSTLRSLNSNLKLYLTNTNRDIVTPLTAAGVNTEKPDAKIAAAESTDALAARLEDARLNAVYDRTYAREMAYQLGTTLTLMNQIYKTTKNASLKTFLESAYTNLEPTQESFANFTTAE